MMSEFEPSLIEAVLEDAGVLMGQQGFEGNVSGRDDFSGSPAIFRGSEGVAVQWQFDGIQARRFLSVPGRGAVVKVQGVTVVQAGTGLFYRYVDWLPVFGQLGIAITPRAAESTGEPPDILVGSDDDVGA